MQIDAIENSLLQATLNPFLKRIIGLIDKECPRDGSLLLNSMKDFLGAPVSLCPSCQSVSNKMAKHCYSLGSSLLHVDMDFMRNQFLKDQFGEAWLRGFGLMMKGVRKYGVRIPFTPAGPFEIVWGITYQCNLRCKHCCENAGQKRPELSTDDAKRVLDRLSKLARARERMP